MVDNFVVPQTKANRSADIAENVNISKFAPIMFRSLLLLHSLNYGVCIRL